MALTEDVSLADVVVTHELDHRPAPDTDHMRVKDAILELAANMADAPERVLPRFVDLAMEITGGVSSGISVAEPPVFRWAFLRGTLAVFEGATTPRDHSPCGLTLDADAPLLTRHSERYYDWIAVTNVVLPEVLLVPLHSGSDLLGTLWIVSDEIGHFHQGHVAAVTEIASFVSAALKTHQIEQQLRGALGEHKVLSREMSHRLKNVFSIVEGMVLLSARNAGSAAELSASLSGRIRALAAAHGLIRRDFADHMQIPNVADMERLLSVVLEPHEAPTGEPRRFALAGPAVPLGEHATNGIALVFNELATNAVKYGALTQDEGKVEIDWRVADGHLEIVWRESGGPPIAGPPSTSGFGTRLVRETITTTLAGTQKHDWRPRGLAVTLRVPVERLAD